MATTAGTSRDAGPFGPALSVRGVVAGSSWLARLTGARLQRNRFVAYLLMN